MLDLVAHLQRRAADALKRGYPDASSSLPAELSVSRATRADFGDLQISSALALAKAVGRPPRELAQVIADGLSGDDALAKIEIAGPGFVNLHLKDSWLKSAVLARASDPRLGIRPIGRGQRVVIDYSSPNVAKPMHVAHIRSTVVGDAIKRVLRAVGYEVIADNHLGDWGTQFGKLIVAYRRWLDPEAFQRAPVDELLRLYIKFVDEEKREKAAADANADANAEESDEDQATPILREARAELFKLQQGDPENVALWRRFVDVSMAEFNRSYRRLGVEFDVVLGESFYNDRLEPTVKLLVERGIAEESRGALVVFFDKQRDGADLEPFLVRKSDGAYLYGSTDVAGMLYRVETWAPARILILTDERQQLHFQQLFATARRLGVTCSLEHIWFGLMRLPEGTISTREGKLISLEALLDEAERRADEIARQRNEELDEAERRNVARVVGLGAVKYNDLSKDRQTLVTFTWEKALSLTGNTAPYLQYAYARMRSILRKAAAEGVAEAPREWTAALSPVERELMVKLLWFPDAVEQVARTARPHILCDYLFEAATAVSTFYADHPVLKAATPELRAARLNLLELASRTLREGLAMLGIEVLERM